MVKQTILLAALLSCVGCAQPPAVMMGQAQLPQGEDSAGFLDRISSQRNVTLNDAMRGLWLLVNNDQDNLPDFAARVQALRDRGIIPTNWDFQADKPVTKGQYAYMIYQACKVRPNLTLLLTGPSRRYCLRELQYQRMMGNGSMWDKVTGMEYVAVLKRAQAYIETGEVPDVMATKAGGF